MVSFTYTSCLDGFSAKLVLVEASQQNSLPQLLVTGLPNPVVQESRERIKSSLNQLGFSTPSKKTLVHLSPAETKKVGSHFDLAIAMALLTVEGFFSAQALQDCAFLGEVSPSGKIHGINFLIPLLERLVYEERIAQIYIPLENLREASIFNSPKIHFSSQLSEVLSSVFMKAPLPTPNMRDLYREKSQIFQPESVVPRMWGHSYAKKVLTLALAGNLPLLLEGPPGSGKTHLAHCAPFLLPDLSNEEQVEVSKIFSFIGENRVGNARPPFRSPHHSISSAAFLGGGQGTINPGEITLAHRGILFLDELPEFRRDSIEGLREPIQNGEIHLNRISRSLTLPARFSLIAAMNPCPCGYFQSNNNRCSCTENQIRNYRKKLSGPILDRFAMYLWMYPETRDFSSQKTEEFDLPSIQSTIKEMQERMTSTKSPIFSLGAQKLLGSTCFQNLSYRRKMTLERVAQGLSLLEGKEIIEQHHLDEAWTLRTPDSLFFLP